MAENINLLPQQSEENSQQTRHRKLLNQVSAIVLSLAILSVIGLFAAKMVLGQQLNALNQDIESAQARITAKKTEEGIQRSLVNRIGKLDEFFTKQNHYSDFVAALSKTLPASLKLSSMIVTPEQQATLSGSVSSYADLAGFYAKLSQSGAPAGSEKGSDFINPMLTSISRNAESNQIEFTLTFGISPKVLHSTKSGDAK